MGPTPTNFIEHVSKLHNSISHTLTRTAYDVNSLQDLPRCKRKTSRSKHLNGKVKKHYQGKLTEEPRPSVRPSFSENRVLKIRQPNITRPCSTLYQLRRGHRYVELDHLGRHNIPEDPLFNCAQYLTKLTPISGIEESFCYVRTHLH